MSIKFLQSKKTTLSYAISDSATTIQLDELLKLDGTSVAASDIGDALQGTFAPGTAREEIFEIDGANVTVNSDGTVTITSVLRGRKEVSPYGSGGFAADHDAGEIVVFGNNPQLYNRFPILANTNAFTGNNSFTLLPTSTGGNATDGDQLITYTQALAMATGTTSINRVVVVGTGGEVLVAGDTVYLDTADQEWKKTDANTAGTVNNVIKGIAQGAGTDGGPITNGVLLFGLDSNQTGMTVGTQYFSDTAGELSATPGTVEVTAGEAISATEIIFYAQFNQQLTETQQDTVESLTAGTLGYAASASGTDAYAITIAPPITAYVNGMQFRFKADVANTGAATLAVSGLSAITIKKAHDVDLATGDIEANQIVEVVYNSTGPVFEMVSQIATINSTDVQTFTADGTWTKPTGAKSVLVQAWGAGGAGGFGDGGGTGEGGGGGGGGAYFEYTFDASDLSATETVVVGAGGTGGSGNGPAGGNSSFGTTKVVAYGGGGGASSVNDGGGGGGGGISSAGTSATTSSGGTGGGFDGGAGGAPGAVSSFGGAGGGNGANTGANGGRAIYGGGGGGGGSVNTGAPSATAGTGGVSFYAGGGGAGGPSNSGGGTQAGGTSTYGGAGGGSNYGALGTDGSIPGGGGGGGSEGFNGGSGARGEVIVTTYF